MPQPPHTNRHHVGARSATPFFSFGVFLFCLCLTFASFPIHAADDLPKEIAARLDPKWIADAKQIRFPEHVAYYHGTAKGSIAPDGKQWTGEIEGEILLLSPGAAMACSKLRLGPTGGITTQGPSQSRMVDGEPPWKKLLEESK